MNSEFLARAEAIFNEASNLSPQQRAAFLEKECAGDTELLALVSRLLSRDSQGMDQFLKPPENSDRLFTASSVEDILVDRYQLERRIGQGGMGQVFLANQLEPQRQVALKILRSDLSTPSLAHRFKLEIEILGRLNHSGIAQIFDAGTTDGGQSFFAMEYVPGLPLTDFVRHHDLSPRERLNLVIQVCDAVHYANEQGVLHRDLKPANILVLDKGDGDHQVKILDFGVARLSQEITPDTSVYTLPGQLLGTLAYMSPEQANGETQDLDPRADVYQLGVILFELLSGKLPLEVDKMPISHALKKIVEQEPPSLGTLDDTLRGDLEIITAKALAKEPQRRYERAGDLGADIRRFLDGKPIVARPTTAFYLIRKRIQRSRSMFLALVALAVISTVAGWALFNQDVPVEHEAPKLTMLTPTTNTKRILSKPAISPDGTQLAVIENPGHLLLKSISGQEEKMLLKGVEEEHLTMHVQWHPSGEKLLLIRATQDGKFPLIWFDLATGEQSTLLSTDEYLQPVISPDGLSALIRRDGCREIAILDLETGDIKSLVRTEINQQYHTPVWGPNSQRIAFIEAIPKIFYRLQCMDLEGNATTLLSDLLLRSDMFKSCLFWHPDGRLFYALGHDWALNDSDLWIQPMNESSCEAAGDPRRVYSFHTLIVRNFTFSAATNRLAFSGTRVDESVGLFEIGKEGGLKKVDLPQTEWPSVPMSFVNNSNDLVIRETMSNNNTDVHLQDIITGEFKPLLAGPEDESPLATSTDGKYLFRFRNHIPDENQEEQYVLWSHCLADSQDINLHHTPQDDDYSLWISSPVFGDGSSYMFSQRAADLVVRKLSATEGLEPEMLVLPIPIEDSRYRNILSVDMSHDARQIAFLVNYEDINIYDLASKETRTLTVDSGFALGMRWSVDGQWLYIRGYEPGASRWIGRMDPQTGQQEILWSSETLMPNEMWMAPNGKHLSCQLRGVSSAVGMLEGL